MNRSIIRIAVSARDLQGVLHIAAHTPGATLRKAQVRPRVTHHYMNEETK